MYSIHTRVNSYFGTLVKRISIINWHRNLNFGMFYTWFFYLAAKITKTNFRSWFEKFSLIFFKIHIHKQIFCWNFIFVITQPSFYIQIKSKYLTILQFLEYRPIFRSCFSKEVNKCFRKGRNRINWKLEILCVKNHQHSFAK